MPVSRREFLKLWPALAAGVSVATGTAIELARLDEKYNLDARVKKWKQISALPPAPENRSIRQAFLKFNAAEIYAQRQGWTLTAEAINRFLTGNGEPWNVTATLLATLKRQFKQDNSTVIWHKFIKDTIQNSFNQPNNFTSRPTRKKMIEKISQNQAFDLSFAAASKSNLSDDLWYSLYRFSISGQTIVNDPKILESGNGVLTLTNTRIVINDIYDWHNQFPLTNIHESISPLNLIKDGASCLGISNPEALIVETFGINTLQALMETELVSIDDKDGLILQNSNLCKTYDIYTDPINVKHPIQVDVAQAFFIKS